MYGGVIVVGRLGEMEKEGTEGPTKQGGSVQKWSLLFLQRCFNDILKVRAYVLYRFEGGVIS